MIGAAPIGDGGTATFQVLFPPGFDPAGSGFIGLVFGGEDFGGMLAG